MGVSPDVEGEGGGHVSGQGRWRALAAPRSRRGILRSRRAPVAVSVSDACSREGAGHPWRALLGACSYAVLSPRLDAGDDENAPDRTGCAFVRANPLVRTVDGPD